MAEAVRLCARGDLHPGTAKRFDVGSHRLALVRVRDEYFAVGRPLQPRGLLALRRGSPRR